MTSDAKQSAAEMVIAEAGTLSWLALIQTAKAMQMELTGPDGIGDALIAAVEQRKAAA